MSTLPSLTGASVGKVVSNSMGNNNSVVDIIVIIVV